MLARAPDHWTVVARVLALRGAPVKGRSANAAHVVRLPGPGCNSVPLLDFDLKSHSSRRGQAENPDGWRERLPRQAFMSYKPHAGKVVAHNYVLKVRGTSCGQG